MDSINSIRFKFNDFTYPCRQRMRVNVWSGSSLTAGATLLYNTSNKMHSMSSMINDIHRIRRIEEGRERIRIKGLPQIQDTNSIINSKHRLNMNTSIYIYVPSAT
jgi:hypothetical protein